MTTVSLKHIAELAGVSRQTVSRALRGERYVRPELAKKILQTAETLGYKPNPRITALISELRNQNKGHRGVTMGLILPDITEKDACANYFHCGFITGVRDRAEACGFRTELVSTLDYTSMAALERVLYARGIELLIIAPSAIVGRHHLGLHWNKYASVLAGPGIRRPRLNRVLSNYYLNMIQILRRLKALGYQRPALVVKRSILSRTGGVIEAAFLLHLSLFGITRNVRQMVWSNTPSLANENLAAWLKKNRVDVVISDQPDPRQITSFGLSVPRDMGYVSMTCNPDKPEVSGINPDLARLGANAVDQLSGHYYRNERGIPADAKIVMHEGKWQPGGTLRG
ncbi:MAG: LacI family DNA-binding transcriptional regulator [Candidatus Methylacidiphilales bacterium]|nr:LacI family DNA-binding transcriptional regulator [Roseimicrobium sp.]